MTKSTPPVTIGLPVHNGERYLEETLKSILSQTYEDFALIISDNASTDRTQEICQTYAAQDERIRYYCNKVDIGIARNFNQVFSLSESKYFKWAAHDDLMGPKFLEVCVDILDNEPEVILAYTKTMIINTEGEVVGRYEDGLSLVSQRPCGRFLQVFHNMQLGTACYGLLRSTALKKSHLMGSYPHSDLVLLAELSLLGQFREAPHYLFFVRLHHASQGGAILAGSRIISGKKDEDKYEDYNPNSKKVNFFKKQHILQKHLITINRAKIPLSSKILLSSFLLSHITITISKKLAKSIRKAFKT